MAEVNNRPFLERLFEHHSKGERDKFFEGFDPKTKWTVHGENAFAKTYNSIQEVRASFQRYFDSCASFPKRKVRFLIVEGNKAAVFLSDEVKGKDGKTYHLDYSFFLELSKDGKKIIRLDNFMDSLTMQHILQAAEKRKAA